MGMAVPIKLYLEKQVVSQIGPQGSSLLGCALGLNGEYWGKAGRDSGVDHSGPDAQRKDGRALPPALSPHGWEREQTSSAGLLGKTLGMLPNTTKGVDEPGYPGMRLWLGHGTSSRAREFVPTMEPFYGEQSGVESWCASCQRSPRGCGELGFLHILMLLKPGTRGLPGLGRAPSPAPVAGSPAHELEEPGAGAPAPSRASGSSGRRPGRRGLLLCLASGSRLPEWGWRDFSRPLLWNGCASQLFV